MNYLFLRKILILFICCVYAVEGTAQVPLFDLALRVGEPASTIPSAEGADANKVAVDAVGNTYVTGTFSGTIRFGPFTLTTSNPANADLFIVKIDSVGNYLWAVQGRTGGLGGLSCNTIALDSNGNAYITGDFSSPTATFGSTTLTNAISVGLSTDLYVAKLTPTGQWLWAVRAGGARGEQGTSIAVDRQSNVYITGNFNSPTLAFGNSLLVNQTTFQTPDLLVAKLDASGTWLWGVRGGGIDADQGTGVTVDARGNVYITGFSSSRSATFGSITLTHALGSAAYVAKLNSAGRYLWAVTSGGDGPLGEGGEGLALDGANNIYVIGHFQQNGARFGTTVLANAGQRDLFVTKLDSAGAWLWAIQSGGRGDEVGTNIVAGERGEVYALGLYSGSALQLGATALPYLGTYQDIFLAKLDTRSRNWEWAVRAGGIRADIGRGLAIDKLNRIYIAGYTQSASVNLSPLTLLANRVGQDVGFMARLTTAPKVQITGDSILCGTSIQLTAKAALPILTYRWNTGATTASIEVTQSGTYSVRATFAGGLTNTTQFQVVRLPPTVPISGDSLLCPGANTVLTAMGSGSAVSYLWNTGANTASIPVTQPGTYSVTIQSHVPPLCVRAGKIRVQQTPSLATFTLGADTTLCENQQLLLRAPTLNTATLYQWSDGSTGATMSVQQAGTYTLRITTPCEERVVSRRIRYRSCLLLPNIITPNGDGLNDGFAVNGLELGEWQLEVYNRWGRQVFLQAKYRSGEWMAHDQPAGVYYYRLSRSNQQYKGWVEVVR